MLGDVNDFLFYDVEVFRYNSMVVFKNYEGKTVRVFSSATNGLNDLVNEGLITEPGFDGVKDYIKGKTLVGFNNYHYDDYILKVMCGRFEIPYKSDGEDGIDKQETLKIYNDHIINGDFNVALDKLDICRTLDVFQQIDVSRPSLKKIEGNMGVSIRESSVDFNIDKPLDNTQNFETFKYCEYDVAQTLEIFKMRSGYFESKMQIVEMLPEDIREKAYKWNTTSIIGQLLKPSQKVTRNLLVEDQMMKMVPTGVRTMWSELSNTQDFTFDQRSVTHVEKYARNGINYDCVLEFGWGGLHGAINGGVSARDVKLFDVASMYPNILIILNGLGDKTDEYKRILEHRLQLKHEGKKKEQAPYKLILNSTYGLLNNQYSALNNPSLAYSICIYGQISLYVLTKRLLEKGCTVINVNTDGVAFVPHDSEDYRSVVDEWEKEFKLKLEESSFKKWIQKDVNNYVAETDTGQIYVKGGDVNNYHDFEQGGRNYYFNNANARIIHKAVVDKILEKNEVETSDTIDKNSKNLHLFQFVLQAGRTYLGTFEKGSDRQFQNVNRVFAGKNTNVRLVKRRHDLGDVNFPDVPEHMIIWNDHINDFKEFHKIDIDWYNQLAEKVYSRWENYKEVM